MAITPECLIHYALALSQNKIDEIQWRNAVNRAYFGAFLLALDKSTVPKNKGSEAHRLVAKYYMNNKPLVYNRLKDLRVLRNEADYDTNLNFCLRDVSTALKCAFGILKELEQA